MRIKQHKKTAEKAKRENLKQKLTKIPSRFYEWMKA
jgi:hypothetical protein